MTKIRDDQRTKIYTFLRDYPGVYAGTKDACRRFLNRVFWILRTGAQWRELPEQYGLRHRYLGADAYPHLPMIPIWKTS